MLLCESSGGYSLFGISRIEATGAYASVSHGFCSTCGKIFPNKDFWCDECDKKELTEGWTTGNASYDAIIRNTQEKANKHNFVCLRWIRLDNLVEIVMGKGGFGKVYMLRIG